MELLNTIVTLNYEYMSYNMYSYFCLMNVYICQFYYLYTYILISKCIKNPTFNYKDIKNKKFINNLYLISIINNIYDN